MLDLVYRLVQSIEKSPSPPSSPLSSSPLTSSTRAVPTAASIANTELVLQKGLEYMINLLDHTDMIVGITTSQILTEMHINCPDRFEKALHDCPTGDQFISKLFIRFSSFSCDTVLNIWTTCYFLFR